MRVLCLSAEPKNLERLAECAYRLTPQVALREAALGEPGYIFLEISKSFHLWSEATVLARLDSMARRLGVSFSLGVGATPGEALARLNRRDFVGRESLGRLSIDALLDFFDPFAIKPNREESLKKITRMISTFRGLGIEFLEDWLNIPIDQCVSRFGYEAQWLHQSIREGVLTVWPKFQPVEIIEETRVIDGFCDGEMFLFYMKSICDSIFLRLSARGQRAEQFEIEIRLRKVVRKILIDFWSPQGGTLSALTVLREKLAREWDREPLGLESMGAEINEVVLRVVKTSQSRILQRDFFSRKEDEKEQFQDLVGRLSETLGEGKVFFARALDRYRPEAAWEGLYASAQFSHAEGVSLFTENRPPRPTRLLKEPLTASLVGAVGGERWLLCSKLNQKWKVKSFEGPERLQGEWWSDTGFQRDYFRVMTEGGESLWVYQSLDSSQRMYLHGFFD